MEHLRVNVSKILTDSLGFREPVQQMLHAYEEPNRFYHDLNHIKEMLFFASKAKNEMSRAEMAPDDYRALQAAIIFHDIVYDTQAKDNEEKSAEAFKTAVGTISDPQVKSYWLNRLPKVTELIMETKKHEFSADKPNANQLIILADLDRFNLPEFEKFWGYTLMLFKEYAQVEFDQFKHGRLAFIEGFANKIKKFMPQQAYDNCMKMIPALQAWHPTIAVYPGSFNPFHKGHLNILEKAEAIFDKVIIARGVNPEKLGTDVAALPEDIAKRYQVDYYDGMLTDYVASKNYPVTVIRGLRNATDLSYEMDQYRHMQDLMPEVNVAAIFCDREYEHVSSKSIRTFDRYGKQNRHKL